jgi:hypothetical protein
MVFALVFALGAAVFFPASVLNAQSESAIGKEPTRHAFDFVNDGDLSTASSARKRECGIRYLQTIGQ